VNGREVFGVPGVRDEPALELRMMPVGHLYRALG